MQRHGNASKFTLQHIVAADLLRAAFGGARLGFQGLKDWRPVHSMLYRPMTGPTQKQMMQLRCRQKCDKAWALLGDREPALLAGAVLQNHSIRCTAELLGTTSALCSEQLAAVLDRLVVALDVPREVAAGRVAA